MTEYVKLLPSNAQLSNFHLHFMNFCTFLLPFPCFYYSIALCAYSSLAILQKVIIIIKAFFPLKIVIVMSTILFFA